MRSQGPDDDECATTGSEEARELTGTAPDVLQLDTRPANVSVVRRRGAGTISDDSARPSAK
ncbi:hypothetical protein EXIGLDRAFT_236871 [Exidia glandulosa HHB12029]|uniref:Uncharacterized protein n=1 Tax=Exidia glandulosa HHB12029 TaxID=1314781 RepID=A0A165E138_EXIGL|nr:hypothetical protein EXIGLDRAFT_236871 [Exidia glandulosa HHB12029]